MRALFWIIPLIGVIGSSLAFSRYSYDKCIRFEKEAYKNLVKALDHSKTIEADIGSVYEYRDLLHEIFSIERNHNTYEDLINRCSIEVANGWYRRDLFDHNLKIYRNLKRKTSCLVEVARAQELRVRAYEYFKKIRRDRNYDLLSDFNYYLTLSKGAFERMTEKDHKCSNNSKVISRAEYELSSFERMKSFIKEINLAQRQ